MATEIQADLFAQLVEREAGPTPAEIRARAEAKAWARATGAGPAREADMRLLILAGSDDDRETLTCDEV